MIYGDFASDILTINGTLKVKTLEIADMGNNNLGLDGDVVPYGGSALGFDLGNNNATEHWDDVVAETYITYVPAKSKTNSKTIEFGLDRLMRLRPVIYGIDSKNFGLIPEEVEMVIPEVVVSQDIDIDPLTGKTIITDTKKGMNYIELIPILIKSIQEQQKIINQLKKDNEYMKAEINKLIINSDEGHR